MSKLPPPEWAADEIFTYATKLRAKHRVRLFHAARTLSLQPPAQVKRVLIQAYGYYARLGGRTAQVVALVKKLFDEAGAAFNAALTLAEHFGSGDPRYGRTAHQLAQLHVLLKETARLPGEHRCAGRC